MLKKKHTHTHTHTHTPFPIETSITSGVTFIGENPTPQTILGHTRVSKWFTDYGYDIPDSNAVTIRGTTATILVEETSTKVGGIITINFVIVKTAFPSEITINNGVSFANKAPTEKNVLDHTRVRKWFADYGYDIPESNTVTIRGTTATIQVTDTLLKNGGIITVNFAIVETAWIAPTKTFTLDGPFNGRKPTQQEVREANGLAVWITEQGYADLVDEDVVIGNSSATITVRDTLFKTGGIITIDFVITKTAFPIETRITSGVTFIGQAPTTRTILDHTRISKWFTDHGYNKPEPNAVTIDGTSATILVADTDVKVSGILTVTFTHALTAFPTSSAILTAGAFTGNVSGEQILNLEAVKTWFRDHIYLAPAPDTIIFDYTAKTATITVAATPTKAEGTLVVTFDHTLAAFPEERTITSEVAFIGPVPTTRTMLDHTRISKWFTDHGYNKPEPNAVTIDGTTATIRVADTDVKFGGTLTVIFTHALIPFTTDSAALTAGIFIGDVSGTQILNLEPVKTWFRDHSYVAPAPDTIIFDHNLKTATISVAPTLTKAGGNLVVTFTHALATFSLDGPFNGRKPTKQEVREATGLADWIIEQEYATLTDDDVIVGDSFATITVRDTSLKTGGTIGINFIITKTALPSTTTINAGLFVNQPNARTILISKSVWTWLNDNDLTIDDAIISEIDATSAIMTIAPTTYKLGTSIRITFSITDDFSRESIYLGHISGWPSIRSMFERMRDELNIRGITNAVYFSMSHTHSTKRANVRIEQTATQKGVVVHFHYDEG